MWDKKEIVKNKVFISPQNLSKYFNSCKFESLMEYT